MNIKFESKNLIFEKLSTKHLSDKYVQWLNDPEVNKFLETGNDYTLEKLKFFLLDQEKKDILFWAIIFKENNEHIGNIKIDPIEDKVGVYGILMGNKDYWGKGLAYEASIAIIGFCFSKIKLKKIKLGVYEDHIGAIKLYKKIGFKIYNLIKKKDSKRPIKSVLMEINNDSK